jgi:hypothetical protein
MKLLTATIAMAIIVAAVAPTAASDSSGRIYGRLTTVDGDVYEGLIRWDKNEGSWVDVLNGNKELYRRHDRNSRKKRIKVFGITITGDGNYDYGSAQSGMSFGHIKMLEVIDDDAVLLTLKSGEEVKLEGGSTDIGESIREIIIEDINEGEIEFGWGDIETIEFMQCGSEIESNFGERLYGTLTTRRDDTYTGWVCWDVDELFTKDILDGEEKHRKRKIKFEKIKAIERYSSSGATVILKNGDELLLRDTNDVNDSNRGIAIYVENFGVVLVEWDEFERLDFETPPNPVKYDAFDGGRPLKGTVYTEDGDAYSGRIRWDDDEEYTWEILDGDFRNIEFDIEFGNIQSIERKGYNAAIVTLWDGSSFRLKGTNDVDDDNKGIFVITDRGKEIEIEWDEFERIEFVKY